MTEQEPTWMEDFKGIFKTKQARDLNKRQVIIMIGMIVTVTALFIPVMMGSDYRAAEAGIICQNAFKDGAKFDSQKPKVVSSLKGETHYLVKVSGKLQNGFGAWQKVDGYCKILTEPKDPNQPFNPNDLIEFEYAAM